VASLSATYVVEHVGTIEHRYTRDEFCERHRDAFGSDVPDKFWAS